MTYFHMGIHTIIGAESFHCPVRDGKEWDQLAMVVRQTDRLAAKLLRQTMFVVHRFSFEAVALNVIWKK